MHGKPAGNGRCIRDPRAQFFTPIDGLRLDAKKCQMPGRKSLQLRQCQQVRQARFMRADPPAARHVVRKFFAIEQSQSPRSGAQLRGIDNGDALAEDVLGSYYLGSFGQPANKPYALLWFRRAAADGNSHAAGELQEWHLAPAARAASDTDNTTITATGDIVPVLPASSCAAHGGYGDDTYCTKDGEQVDPASGVALAQNDPGYVDDDEINKNDEIEPGPEPSNPENYDPQSEPGGGDPDIGGGGGGGGEPDIDIGGGGEEGDD